MRAKFCFLLLLIAACGCKSSSPTSVEPKTVSNLPANLPQQSAIPVLPSNAPEPIRSYSIKQHPYYAPYIMQAISNLVARHGKSKRNHFYFSQVKEYSSGNPMVWLYWKEGRIVMTWDQNTGLNKDGEYAPELDLVYFWPRHVYRLDRDLVKGLYTNGNDGLTETEATEIIRDCKQNGDLFLIQSS